MSTGPLSYPHPQVSWFRQLLNFVGCLLLLPICRAFAVNTRYPATVDLLISILLAECCRFNNESRRIAYRETETQHRSKDDVEKRPLRSSHGQQLGHSAPRCETVAAIVGWREDPELWARCLESYKTTRGCRFLLAGIDGIDEDDREMVDVFGKVGDTLASTSKLPSPCSHTYSQMCVAGVPRAIRGD